MDFKFVLFFQYLHCGDDPEQRPKSPELRAFIVATLKLVDLIKDIIAKASVFEEEDFQPLTYGFQLATDVSEAGRNISTHALNCRDFAIP